MQTDKLAYLWFQEIPQGFFALIGRNKLDASGYAFKSVELKETSFRLDAVFAPLVSDDFTYFVEVQFQRDALFYARLLAEVFLYLKQFQVKKWRVVVIYPNRNAEQEDLGSFSELLNTNLIQRIYLNELPSLDVLDETISIFKLAVEPNTTAIQAAKMLAERAPEQLDFIERVLFYKFSNLTRREILNMLGIKEEFEEELKKTKAYQEILAEGIETGIQQGIQQGELKGKIQAVPLLRKLGMSNESIAKELNLPIEQVSQA